MKSSSSSSSGNEVLSKTDGEYWMDLPGEGLGDAVEPPKDATSGGVVEPEFGLAAA